MKIMLNRPIKKQAWGGGTHFITGFYNFLKSKGYEVCFEFEKDIDFIFMFDPRPDSRGRNCVNQIYSYVQHFPKTKIIQRINDTDIARPLDKPWRVKLLLHANQIADHTVFISEWLKMHYIERGFDENKKHSVVLNGCNQEYFYPYKNKEKKNEKEKIKIITHHWSDNYMKGFDIYNYLDLNLNFDRYEFTYLGRYNKNYMPKNIKIISPKYGKEVGDILRQHDIYITGARYEACGMHHIEAASCGLPIIYHKDGGGINEVCKNHGIMIKTPEESINAIDELAKNKSVISEKISYNKLSEKKVFEKYEKLLVNY